MRVDFNPMNPAAMGVFDAQRSLQPAEADAENQYRMQTREAAEERNMLRSRAGFREEDRNGITIRSRDGDQAEISFAAMNFQRNTMNQAIPLGEEG
jgi:hypothetical protein